MSAFGPSLEWDGQSGLLVGGRCPACGYVAYPAPSVCPRCLNEEIERYALPPAGELYTFTTVHVGPRDRTLPYTLGYVDFPDGVRVLGRLETAEASIGSRYRPVPIPIGADHEGAELLDLGFARIDAS